MAGTLLFNALKEAIDEEMANDVNVCVMGEDVGQYGGSYKVTKDLYEKYGELRVLDTPIAENSFTGMAVGAAMTGLRPIVEGMNMGFLLLAFNQISNNMVCLDIQVAEIIRYQQLFEDLEELAGNLVLNTVKDLKHIFMQFQV